MFRTPRTKHPRVVNARLVNFVCTVKSKSILGNNSRGIEGTFFPLGDFPKFLGGGGGGGTPSGKLNWILNTTLFYITFNPQGAMVLSV